MHQKKTWIHNCGIHCLIAYSALQYATISSKKMSPQNVCMHPGLSETLRKKYLFIYKKNQRIGACARKIKAKKNSIQKNAKYTTCIPPWAHTNTQNTPRHTPTEMLSATSSTWSKQAQRASHSPRHPTAGGCRVADCGVAGARCAAGCGAGTGTRRHGPGRAARRTEGRGWGVLSCVCSRRIEKHFTDCV